MVFHWGDRGQDCCIQIGLDEGHLSFNFARHAGVYSEGYRRLLEYNWSLFTGCDIKANVNSRLAVFHFMVSLIIGQILSMKINFWLEKNSVKSHMK